MIDSSQPTIAYTAFDARIFGEHLLDLLHAAQQEGFKVLCFCPISSDFRRLKAEGVVPVAIPACRDVSPLRDAASWLLMTSACIEHRVSVVHSFSNHLAASWAARIAGVPVHVATVLGADEERSALLRQSLRWSASCTDVWIAHHLGDAKQLQTTLGLSDVITFAGGFGADTKLFSPAEDRAEARARARIRLRLSPRRTRWVGYVGPLDGAHGSEIGALIDAIAARDTTTGVAIVVRGVCDQSVLQMLRHRLQESDGVVVLRDRTPHEMVQVYSALDLLVAPVVRTSLCCAVMEAGAMRLPVVGYDHPWLRAMIEDGYNGRLVRDRAALVEAMMMLLDVGQQRRMMGAAARLSVVQSDAYSSRAALFELYRALLRTKTAT